MDGQLTEVIQTDASFAVFFLQAGASAAAAKGFSKLPEVSYPKEDRCA